MSQQTNDPTPGMSVNGAIAGCPQECLREHIVRAILIYARRHRHVLRGFSEEQVRCIVEAVAEKAERAVHDRLDRYLDSIKPTTWIAAIAIREAMYVFTPNDVR